MLTNQKLDQLLKNFKGIFTMPVSHSTYKELQNVILFHSDNKIEILNALFDSLLRGEITPTLKNQLDANSHEKALKLVDDFCIPTRYAKAVFERGDYLNLISSDFINQNNQLVLVNTIRLVDGKELRFLSDIGSTLSILKHFLGRLTEIQKNDQSKTVLNNFEGDLKELKEKVEKLSAH